jgi:CDGSH-type Zn-finger protein
LLYFCHNKKYITNKGEVIAFMDKPRIQVLDNGPLVVRGEVELVDAEGNVFETKKQFSLCRCGLAQNKPFCDGSHKGKFESQVRAQAATEQTK